MSPGPNSIPDICHFFTLTHFQAWKFYTQKCVNSRKFYYDCLGHQEFENIAHDGLRVFIEVVWSDGTGRDRYYLLDCYNYYNTCGAYNISQKSGKDKASDDVAENKVQFASKADMLIAIGKSRLFGRENLFSKKNI